MGCRLRCLLLFVMLLGLGAGPMAGAAVASPAPATTARAATAHAVPAGYVPKSALINGDSVTTDDGITDAKGNPISLEQFAAQQLGYTVTVVDGSTWDAMTAAQFADFQLLIVGDPFCGTTPASVLSDASTWAPVVMGTSGLNSTVGNRTLVGTDPEDHYAAGGGGAQPTNPSDPTTAGAEHLVQDGLNFAGAVSGATGIYFDTSCNDPGGDVAALNALSVTGTGFTEDTSPPCGGSVQLIAANPAFSTGPTILTDGNIQGWSCSDHITFPTFPTDWQPLAVATDTASHATCGTDPDTMMTACGESYVLLAGTGVVVTAPDLALTPATHTDPVGGSHTVTATVNHSGTPVAGATVSFVITGQNGGVSGTCSPLSCATDGSGVVTFTYSDTNGAGTDTIDASVTVSGSLEHANATENWTSATASASVAIAAQSSAATPGGKDGYIVTLTNPGAAAVTLTSIVDTLPSGFAYTAGSSTGGITADPSISGSTLTWNGTFSAPAGGSFTFQFGVTVSTTPGPYTDSVTGMSTATLSPATATAVINVATIVPTPAFPVEGLPLAAIIGGTFAALWWRRRRRSATA